MLACEETLDFALSVVDEKRRISLLNFFEHNYYRKLIASKRGSSSEDAKSLLDLPHNCVLIRKVTTSNLKTKKANLAFIDVF